MEDPLEGDVYCLNCGYRKARATNGVGKDPLAGVTEQLAKALAEIKRQEAVHAAGLSQAKRQARAVERTLRMLRGTGADGNARRCKECGETYFSAAHKAHRAKEAKPA